MNSMPLPRCAFYQGAVGKGKTADIFCTKEVSGRYVFVMLRATDYLTLCEVEVFGIKGGNQSRNSNCISFPCIIMDASI